MMTRMDRSDSIEIRPGVWAAPADGAQGRA